MSTATRARDAYWKLLGESDRATYVTKTVDAVMSNLYFREAVRAPISLSSVTGDYLVDPRPKFSSIRHKGCLQFDSENSVFQICLDNSMGKPRIDYPLMTYLHGDPEPDDDLYLTKRGRFTYAHEFAHRFFYAEHKGGWARAVDIVDAELPTARAEGCVLDLHRSEERMCNEIARNLLLPTTALSDRFRARGLIGRDTSETALQRLPSVLMQEGKEFAVPLDVVIIQAQRIASCDAASWAPHGLFLFVLRNSRRKGSQQLARSAFRVTTSIFPKSVGGVRLRPLYPGVRFAHFGESLNRDAMALVAAASGTQIREFCSVGFLETMPESSAVRPAKTKVEFKGWYWRESSLLGQPAFLWGAIAPLS